LVQGSTNGQVLKTSKKYNSARLNGIVCEHLMSSDMCRSFKAVLFSEWPINIAECTWL
jgi:hypothetical protein